LEGEGHNNIGLETKLPVIVAEKAAKQSRQAITFGRWKFVLLLLVACVDVVACLLLLEYTYLYRVLDT
jgi:hypothetical protein